MRHPLSYVGFVGLGILIVVGSCRRADEPQRDESSLGEHAARKPPEFRPNLPGETSDANSLLAEALRRNSLPAGHPPISSTLPAGHPPTSSMLPASHPPLGNAGKGDALPPGHPPIDQTNGPVVFSGDLAPPHQMLEFDPPRNWTTKPARPMTVAIYSLSGANNSAADAELAISHYPGMKDIPLQDHVDRWAGQFGQPSGEANTNTVKQTRLEGTTHPTTLVDISGTYQTGSMMGPTVPPQENHRMLSGIVETEKGPWFFKLTGPAETVAAHERDFVEMLRHVR